MEKIKIRDRMYDIKSIQPVSEKIICIVFNDSIPSHYPEKMELYTNGKILATTLTGYNTVYRDEGRTVYLSNDGSVYVPPADPVEPEEALPPEPYLPTLAELQVSKKLEVSAMCEKIIYAGVDVTFKDNNTEHFSLTEHDQLNLFGKQAQLAAGVTQLEYHADGQPCRYYSAADMQSIIQAAMWHVSYHTTYCNALNMWIAGCGDEEELQGIFYGADIPEEYQSDVLKAYLVEMEDKDGDTDETVY